MSYRVGLAVVLLTVAASTALCLATVDPRPNAAHRAEDVESIGRHLDTFRLVERSGRPVTQVDLQDRVWVAAFVFSRCPSSCPRISAVMKGLQADLAGTEVLLASLSVDPDHDRPEVLRAFADRYGADPDRWWFLTGAKGEVYSLILDRFTESVADLPEADRQEAAEAVSHSDRLALVGPGNVVLGSYRSTEPDAVRRLLDRARGLDKRHRAARIPILLKLPTINAALNATCGVLLAVGWTLIRSKRVRAHAACMAAALGVSALFLACYLVYHYHVGSVAFRGEGPIRVAYLAILLSHTVLAVAVVPLVATTVTLAIRRKFAAHAKVARATFPIWMYVSITGVVVYWMLYRMPIASPYPA